MYNGKEKICKFYVAHNSSPVVLGMQDIDKLDLISISYSTKHRQVPEEDMVEAVETIARAQGKQRVASMSCSKVRSRKQKHKTQKILQQY